MNTSNIFDRLSRKIHHHSDMEPHESDSGPPFGEVEPLNFHDEESVCIRCWKISMPLAHWPMN